VTGSLHIFAGLLRKVQPGEALYLVGTRKSAGKTTALNAIVALCSQRKLGLVTIGIDGEERDLLFDTDKPRVTVPAGALVCTTDRALAASDASVTVLRTLGIHTSMGWLMLARVERGGAMLMVGPETNAQVHMVVDMLFNLGAETVLVDGAFDRRTQLFSRQPKRPSWFVLVAAPAQEPLDTFVDNTAAQCRLLGLPEVPEDRAAQLPIPDTIGAVACDFDNGARHFDSMEAAAQYCGDSGEHPGGLAIAGPLMQRHIPLLKIISPRRVIVSSGALVFVSPQGLRSLQRLGISLYQHSALRPLALVLNTSRRRSGFIPATVARTLSQAVHPLAVVDLMHDAGTEARA